MAENEESPKHGSLSGPVKRPNDPSIRIESGEGQCENDEKIPENVAEGPPWILDPAMLWNSGSDLGNLERWRITQIEIVLGSDPISITAINGLCFLSGH